MKIKMVSLLAVAALFLSLCACGGGEVETNRHEVSGEIGASPSTDTDPSSSKTVNQPASGTGTTSGETETTSRQTTTTTQTGTTTRALEVLQRGNSTWKEVPIQEGARRVLATFFAFDLQETITNADYVFSGKVVSRKEYEVSWTDKDGKLWGPYKNSIIEVEVSHNYYGQSPVNGNIIKVLYPYSLSAVYENSVLIKEQGEYVFVTQALDEKFVERKKKDAPLDGSEEEKYADVYINNPIFSSLPIEKGNVIAYDEYFNWNKDIMKKVKPDMETDKISSGETKGRYIVLDKGDFDRAFNQFFENPQTLPTSAGEFMN